MWSVWAERLDLYVCRGQVWIRRPGRPMASVTTPPTLPLQALLRKVEEALQADAPGSRCRVHISLSAQLCPPVVFEAPKGIRWKERAWIAQRKAALHWGLAAEQADKMACVLSPTVHGLAAAMPGAMLELIRQWVGSQGWQCVAMEPMWSHLTLAHRQLLRQASGLELLEPDGGPVVLGAGADGSRVRLAWTSRSGDQASSTGGWKSCFEADAT